MVSGALAPKWTLPGIAQRFSRLIDEPADAWLAWRVGWFVYRAPGLVKGCPLPELIARLRADRAGESKRYRATLDKIDRIRGAWLRRPGLRDRDTCYVRALTLYRFLEVEDHRIGLHIGIEHRDDTRERLRGHAWVTLDGALLEGPDAVRDGRVRELPLGARAR
ncbi:MAG: lasso peptide biosynthesis B2 protein [Vulcanimicrobiaceae bacterium]